MDFPYQEWEKRYYSLRNDYQNLRKQCQRDQPGSSNNMNQRILVLERALQMMRESPMQYELTSSEIARRQVILDNLKKGIAALGTTTDARINLISGGSGNHVGGGAGGGGGGASTTTTINPLASDRSLIQRQQEVIKMQDAVLLDIEKGVDRLHGQALTIKDETIQQNQILDELDVQVDKATEGLQREATHAEQIKARTGDCYLYMCVLLEVIVLIALLVVSFA